MIVEKRRLEMWSANVRLDDFSHCLRLNDLHLISRWRLPMLADASASCLDMKQCSFSEHSYFSWCGDILKVYCVFVFIPA